MATYPKYALSLMCYSAFGYRLYDADLVYQCACCHGTQWKRYENISRSVAKRIARQSRQDARRWTVNKAGWLESYLRIRDDPCGCYGPQGYWLSAPIHQLEIEDAMAGEKQSRARKENLTLKLAYWFVTEYLQRPWQEADYKGSAMKHASLMLKDYDLLDIQGCLLAAQDGDLGDMGGIALIAITSITKFEPPLIVRWFDYVKTPPPIWKIDEYNRWARRTGKDEIPTTRTEEPSDRVLLWPPGMRPEADPTEAR